MQYQVPQFIEVEDKIFGPLTIKQFVYLAGGAGLSFVLWRSLPHIFAMPLIGALGGLSVALAFIKINNRPFIFMLESAFMFIIHPRLYIWQVRKTKKKIKEIKKQTSEQPVPIPNLTKSKLKDLAWGLDINEHLAVERAREKAQEKYGDSTPKRFIIPPEKLIR